MKYWLGGNSAATSSFWQNGDVRVQLSSAAGIRPVLAKAAGYRQPTRGFPFTGSNRKVKAALKIVGRYPFLS
jgi:hypothetical protein